MLDKIMFDSNAFDKLLRVLDNLRQNIHKFDFYITAIQIEEIANIPDIKSEKRVCNLLALCELRAKLVPVSFVFNHSRLGFCCFGDDENDIYSLLLNENQSNVNDALIGEAAKREGCILVTDDTRFIKKLTDNNIPTITFQQFEEKYLT